MKILMKTKMLLAVICQFFLRLFMTDTQAQAIDLSSSGWRYSEGDDAAWATPQYNDASWREIPVGTTWEAQFGNEYDGWAWYRRTIVVPKKDMKRAARKSGALILKLGMIDDADETYFNGVKIGATGKFPPEKESAYNIPRIYIVPCDLIDWDKPNTIAVRVNDWGGGGGLYSGEYSLEASSWKDKFKIMIDNAVNTHAFTLNNPVAIKPQLVNNAKQKLEGILTCEIKKFTGESVASQTQNVKINKGQVLQAEPFSFDNIKEAGFYITNLFYKDKKGITIKEKKGFAIEPEQIKPSPTRPADFDAYWQKTRTELDTIPPQYNLKLLPKKSNDKVDVHEVTFNSLGNARVRGYYTQPKTKNNLPALLHVQGYSSVMEAWELNEDFAAFFLNIRGHGNSKDDVNPGFPGYLIHGIDNKDNYIYRGAYMDCVRAVDFLCSREEVNKDMVCVEGGSQGGALSVATASLDSRIKYCMPDVPFLSNFRLYFDIAQWPSNEFKDLHKKGKSWEDIYGVLDYIDIMNHAPNITCPILMGVGLYDDICPPAINFSMYNNLNTTDKSYILYPQAGHSLPNEHYGVKMKWLRGKLGMK
jgi:cephalosporin-C deacetylase